MRSFFLGSLFLMLLCSACSKGGNEFIGEWQESKDDRKSWKIEKSSTGFSGTRTGIDDFYEFDSETWKSTTQNGMPALVNKDGTTLTYIEGDRILRLPPGITYKRKKTE